VKNELETVCYSRSFAPSIASETASFTVTIAATIETSDQRDELMDYAKVIYEAAAKPIVRSMRLDRNRPQDAPRITIIEPDCELSPGISIEKISLGFAQTWVIDKPYPTTISPSCATELQGIGGGIEPIFIAMAWQMIIDAVLLAAEESLIASGRWATRLNAPEFTLK
jgi:hypothetical protein